jgi:hypothetical protein
MAIDRVSASMYLSEVRDLVAGIEISIDRIEALGQEWLIHQQNADALGTTSTEEWNPREFSAALHASRVAQGDVFMLFEALLAQWARLSLLFFPILDKKQEPGWRRKRGEVLRYLVDLPPDTVLGDREARDAWMHFDERLDRAVQEGWLGNRQTFVASRRALDTAAYSVRVLDMEAGALYYRDRDGGIQSIELNAMRQALGAINRGLEAVRSRIGTLPSRPS